MFRVTTLNLSADARSASADFGRNYSGEFSNPEAIVLLEQFRQIDPVENLECEPEIIFETRTAKAVVRTIQHRLYLYDSKRFNAPALTLTAELIVAELDGSAAEARTRAALAAPIYAIPATPDYAVATPTRNNPAAASSEELLKPSHRALLVTAIVGLLGYIAFPRFAADPAPPAAEFAPLSDSTRAEAIRSELAGVYVTGTEEGDHGISLAKDGALKLVLFNSDRSPSVLHDTYRVGRSGGAFAVVGSPPGGVILQVDRDTLLYFGETYRRVQ